MVRMGITIRDTDHVDSDESDISSESDDEQDTLLFRQFLATGTNVWRPVEVETIRDRVIYIEPATNVIQAMYENGWLWTIPEGAEVLLGRGWVEGSGWADWCARYTFSEVFYVKILGGGNWDAENLEQSLFGVSRQCLDY